MARWQIIRVGKQRPFLKVPVESLSFDPETDTVNGDRWSEDQADAADYSKADALEWAPLLGAIPARDGRDEPEPIVAPTPDDAAAEARQERGRRERKRKLASGTP